MPSQVLAGARPCMSRLPPSGLVRLAVCGGGGGRGGGSSVSNHRLRTLSPGPCRLKLVQPLQAGLTMSSSRQLLSSLWRMREEEEMKNAIAANGELPSGDDGLVELPSDDCDDGGAWSSQAKAAATPAKATRHPHRAKAPPTHAQMTEWAQNPNARKRQRIPEQMRKWLGEPRGDQPRDVIPGPSAGGPRVDHPGDVIPGPSAGDSLAAGNIDLPEEVANGELDDLLEDVTTATPKEEDVATDELDDLFVDVTTGSPRKQDRSLATTLREKKETRCVPGAHPCRCPGHNGARSCSRCGDLPGPFPWWRLTGRCDGSVLAPPPRILKHTAAFGLRGHLSVDLATGWDLSLGQHRTNLLTDIMRRRPKIVLREPPCTWFCKANL